MDASSVRRVGVRGFVLIWLIVGVALLVCSPDTAGAAILIERVSVSSMGAQAIGGDSFGPAITPDGRYVAFYSSAENLVSGDTNGVADVFVRDRLTGVTERVSVGASGVQAQGGGSYSPSISANGRYVAFASRATNLVTADTNGLMDIFVRDREGGFTTRVNLGPGGAEATGGDSEHPAISPEGRFVAFASAASNLVDGDTNGRIDIFVRDRMGAQTTRVNLGPGGVQAEIGDSGYPAISAEGRYVAFQSLASNLVYDDTNGAEDIFVRDRQTSTTSRASLTNANSQAEGHSMTLSISADGRFVAFASSAANLVSGDTNGMFDIFVRDRIGSTTTRVNLGPGRAQAVGGDSFNPRLSADGRHVVYHSGATNLVVGDTNDRFDVFAHDTLRGTTRRASVSAAGVQGNDESFGGSVTYDGRRVAFFSSATNLVSGDTNASNDVFVHTGPAVVTRLSDRTRFSTAVAIARDAFPGWVGVKHVVIASGDDRAAADPLAASGLCWAYDAPMLLVSAARTPDEVKVAIKQIVALDGPITLHVVGGPISVPDARLNDIKAYVGAGNITVDRILSTGGRYDLARAIALRMKSVAASNPAKTMPGVLLFANGADSTKFFDALALSPISAGTGAPILLVTATSVPPATAAAVAELAPPSSGGDKDKDPAPSPSPSTTKIVGGGPNTVSEAVRTQLGATRWSGRSRYDTAIAIADGAVAKKWLTRSHVGLAAKLPDALTGGSLIGKRKGVLLLTDGATLTPVTKSWLTTHKMSVAEAYLFGGPLSITEAVKTQVGNALQ